MINIDYNVETLYDWFKIVLEAKPDAKISLRTAHYMNLIMNKATTKNYLVFDNSGGMLFDILKIDNESDFEPFIKQLGVENFFGKVIKGKASLSEYQKNHPHWEIQSYLRKKKVKYLNDKFKGKFVKVKKYVGLDLASIKGKKIKILNIEEHGFCSIEVDGKKHDTQLGIFGELDPEVNLTLIE